MSFSVARMLMPVVVIGLTLGVSVAFLRRGFPDAWQRWVKRATVVGLGVALVGFVGWEILRVWRPHSAASGIAMTLTSTVFVSAIALALSAIVWGPPAVLTHRRPVDPTRRAFLRRLTGAVPVAAASSGPAGAVAASLTPVLTPVDIASPSVPAALDGLTILQLTDVHLGVFIHEEQLQAVVDAVRAAGIQPDAIVLTGDICDDYTQLPGALRRLKALRPRLGMFACIGNHEIYRGRQKAEAIYADEGVEFLCDGGVLLEHNGARLWLAGANDPARGIDGPAAFLEETVKRAMAGCPADVSCRVLLAHRPRAFITAATLDVTLTLSGHTHGAQMALWGRSLLEPLWPESFLLGHYRRASPSGTSHLYTSAGLGHWMPFRLNCPCEAVLVTLRSAPATAVS
jgi:predicted MPP superfamily phosphohydrolase